MSKSRLYELLLLLSFCSFVTSGQQIATVFFTGGFGRWIDGGHSFDWNIETRLFFVNKSSNLVMVSFTPGSPLSHSLMTDKRTLAYSSDEVSGIGRAILQLSTDDERDDLAAKAHQDTQACGSISLINMTNQISLPDASPPLIPTTVASESIASALSSVSATSIQATAQALENLGSRYHAGAEPNEASDAIKASWESYLPTGGVLTQESHSGTSQKSVVLRIPASSPSSETVLLGAHLDSINVKNQNDAPGADDDASGVAALTEILRLIKSQAIQFKRNVELHAYAAEEVGLIGSSDLAAKRRASGTKIVAMLQLDMIGYGATDPDPTLHVITTDTSPVLVRHLKDIISTYSIARWSSAPLSAGTSDHKSWTINGFHAAFAFEHPKNYNKHLHTADDTSDRLDFTLAAAFTKLALGFLSHEAGYIPAITETAAGWQAQQATGDEIKLASVSSDTGGERLVAAVKGDVAGIEFCKISSKEVLGCQSMVSDTTMATQRSDRRFFVTKEDLTLNDADVWRISAYSPVGTLVAMRQVRLRPRQ